MILSTLENGAIIKKQVSHVEFDLDCDVLCIGAGSAGIYAADAAASEGARVILCEIGSNIGGMSVCGNVTSNYYGAFGGSHEQDLQKAIADTVFLPGVLHWEQKQIYLVERLRKSGVTLLCRHSATGIYWDGNRVIGLRVFNGQAEINIKAAITIDTTSDGHLIRMTDVKKYYGKPTDCSFVPFTVRVQYTENRKLRSCNEDSGRMNHYNAADFSRNTVFSHANAARLLQKGEFVNLALQMGIREGLTFEGEESVSYSDILLRKPPERVLFWAYSDLDRHGSERATDEELFQNWWVISNLATVTVSIPVPMGSIVPKGIRGLITAGRCLCCDTYSQSAVRMNRDMFRMGECVGVAASMAALGGTDFLEIDYDEFLSQVKRRGCFDGYADREFGFDNSYIHYLNKMKSLGRAPDKKYDGLSPNEYIYEPISFEADKNFHLLKTDAPGVAIWSCCVSMEQIKIKERLYSAMYDTEDTLYKYNCAIALALLQDERALPVLREIVKERDCFFFTDNRRSNQFRSAVAVCLLGRLGNEDDLPQLFEILSEREIHREMYHTLKANYLYHATADRNFVYFAMLTHACMAIYKIYRRCGLNIRELHLFFDKLFGREELMRRVTDAKAGEPAYEEMNGFIKYMLKITKDD